MLCTIHPDVADFAGRALPWLERDPVLNSIVTTNTVMRLRGLVPDESPPLWITASDERGELVGVAIRTPPRFLLLADMAAEVAAALAEFVHEQLEVGLPAAAAPGVVGPVGPAEAFAARWTALTGTSAHVVMSQRAFRLDRVVPPTGVPGRFRPAEDGDLDLCCDWMMRFRREALPAEPGLDRAFVSRVLADRRLGLWEDGGRPVSMVGWAIPVAGVLRIGPVYTPPELRGHGYASAATAVASQRGLDAGAVACTLNTDLANPTSNAIYQRIGYYPVGDAVSLHFEA